MAAVELARPAGTSLLCFALEMKTAVCCVSCVKLSCVVYSVPSNENLFNGNRAMLPRGDPAEETPATFCLCDMRLSNVTQCGRKAVSDTTADANEPSVAVRLAVPLTRTTARRRRRAVVNIPLVSDVRAYSANVK